MKDKTTAEETAQALDLMRQVFPTAMEHVDKIDGEAMPRTCHDLMPGETFPQYEKPEIPDYEQAKVDCLAYIAELGVTAEIKPNGVHETPAEGKGGKPWLHFRWSVTAINRKATHQPSANFDDYKTGIGNSTFQVPKFSEPCGGSVTVKTCAKNGTIYRLLDPQTRLDACHYLKPKAPDIADILGSYARDYMDANRAGSFEDWAGDFGLDLDSRKAEETYRACLAQRKPLMQLGLSLAEIEKIADYASQF